MPTSRVGHLRRNDNVKIVTHNICMVAWTDFRRDSTQSPDLQCELQPDKTLAKPHTGQLLLSHHYFRVRREAVEMGLEGSESSCANFGHP